MTTSTDASSANSAAAGKDAAWVAYVLHAIGYLSVVMWLAVVGLIVNYVKRGDAKGGFADSHHEWLIRTFWYGLLWHTLSVAALLWSAWPWVRAIRRTVSAPGTIVIEWGTIFSSIGAAALGGMGIFITWVWLLYRVIRGAYRLANSQPMP